MSFLAINQGTSMNKEELISSLASKTGNTKTETAKFLNGFIDVVTNILSKQQEINLVGFGKFYVATRKATKGKNPRTGESIDIPESKSPKFKPGKKLKDKVN